MKILKDKYYLIKLALSSFAFIIALIALIVEATNVSKKIVKIKEPEPVYFKAEITELVEDNIKNLKKSQEISDISKRNDYNSNTDVVLAHVGIGAPSGQIDNKPDFTNNHPVVAPVTFNLKKSHQLARGVGFKSDGLLIETAGNYFVYVSAKFLIDKNVSCYEHYSFYLYLMKIPADDVDGTEPIIRLAHTCVQGTTQGGVTKFNGRALYLAAGDIIQVLLSGKGFIDYGLHQTYLGLFRLS